MSCLCVGLSDRTIIIDHSLTKIASLPLQSELGQKNFSLRKYFLHGFYILFVGFCCESKILRMFASVNN